MMKTFVLAAALSLTAFGCKKKGGADCDSAVSNAIDRSMAEEMKAGGDMPPEMKKQAEEMMKAVVPKIKSAMIKSCKDDKWSDEVLKCMNDAKTKADFDGCENKLTPQQKSNAEKAAAEAMGMGGAMGGGDHGTTEPAGGSAGSAEMGGSAAGSAEAGSAEAGSAAPAGGSADMGSAAGSAGSAK